MTIASNRCVSRQTMIRLGKFCADRRIAITFDEVELARLYRWRCTQADYRWVVLAVDAIEEIDGKADAWLAAYLSDATMPPCAIGSFEEPLSERLEAVAVDHFLNCERYIALHDEWKAEGVAYRRSRAARRAMRSVSAAKSPKRANPARWQSQRQSAAM